MQQKPTPSEQLISGNALTLLDTLLKDSDRKRVGKDQVMLILDALASSPNPALVERFAAVLALCIRNGIDLDGQALLSRYWQSSPKRQNLEKLMLISVALFERQKMPTPGNLKRIAAGLKQKYLSAAPSGNMQLSTGVNVTMKGLQQALRQFGLMTQVQAEKPPTGPLAVTPDVRRHLARLFSPKQRELVLKKLNNEPMTKTEREYYSRTSKKKLGAILDDTVQEIARRLCSR